MINHNKNNNSSENPGQVRSPWFWIPSLYIAEGLPYFAVNVLTVLMYVQLGISNTEMAFYTGALYLPWVIKPFWSPFVDLFSTKRLWVIIMQLTIAVCFALIAALLSASFFFASTLAVFWIIAFASATHDIAADGYYMLELNKEQQAAYVGVRSTFYRVASVLGQGGLVIYVGYLQKTNGNITLSWQIAFGLLSILFLVIALWHIKGMPRPASDHARSNLKSGDIVKEFFSTFLTFFQKPYIGVALAFMLLYRLPEALCIKLTGPFLLAPYQEGGLALSLEEVGFANGTVGVIALLLGGIIGGLAIARHGLKRWLWPMALSLTLPCVFYCMLAMWQPHQFWITACAIAVEQFGYGFGFTAFMMYLIYFADGKNATSHYAFCTAFMAIGMMLPGMAAGWIWKMLGYIYLFDADTPQGYINFFWLVMLTSVATLAVTAAAHRILPPKATPSAI
ncbi:MAG: MFS transporter [Muribaculum sp.]|nr:MFS transporter [Muribaculum sp.]